MTSEPTTKQDDIIVSAIYVDLVDSSADSKSSSSSSNGGSSSSTAAEEVKKILDDVIENVTGVKKEMQQQHPVRRFIDTI